MRANLVSKGLRSMRWDSVWKLRDLEVERMLLPEPLNLDTSLLQVLSPIKFAT